MIDLGGCAILPSKDLHCTDHCCPRKRLASLIPSAALEVWRRDVVVNRDLSSLRSAINSACRIPHTPAILICMVLTGALSRVVIFRE